MQTRTKNGVVVIGGVPYRRSDFQATHTTSGKDWALLGLVVAMMVVFMLASIVLLVWAIGAIGRQIQAWR